MTDPVTTRTRWWRLGLVVALGLAIGFGAFVVVQRLTLPQPRPAPGWSLLAELPVPRGETAAAVVGGRVYVAGGYRGLEFETTALVSIYDPMANAWSDGPGLPEPRNHAAAAEQGGMLYVSGGTAPTGVMTDSLWGLSGLGAWEPMGRLPAARSAHRMVALAGKLYLVGGLGGPADGPGAAGQVLIFDPTNHGWTFGASMPANRDHLAVVVVGNEIWAIGGRIGGQNVTNVDIYDPKTDAWRDGPPLPEATSGAAEAAIEGAVYISGGEDPIRGSIVDRHWRLDTALGDAARWEPLAGPPLAVHGVAGLELDGRFMVIGGATRAGAQSNTAWVGATQAFRPEP